MFFRLKRSNADIWFSKVVRTRDNWTCQRCQLPCEDNKGYLDCSHYFSRAMKSVRFDPENAVALCKKCHDYFTQKNEKEHEDFFITRIGKVRFDLLSFRAHQATKVDEKLIVLWCKEELTKLEEKDGIILGKH